MAIIIQQDGGFIFAGFIEAVQAAFLSFTVDHISVSEPTNHRCHNEKPQFRCYAEIVVSEDCLGKRDKIPALVSPVLIPMVLCLERKLIYGLCKAGVDIGCNYVLGYTLEAFLAVVHRNLQPGEFQHADIA